VVLYKQLERKGDKKMKEINTEFGYADVAVFENEITEEKAVKIDFLYVNENCRKQGHGEELLRQAIEYAKGYNLPVYIVASELDEDVIELSDLVEFYENMGFEVEDANGESVVMLIN